MVWYDAERSTCYYHRAKILRRVDRRLDEVYSSGRFDSSGISARIACLLYRDGPTPDTLSFDFAHVELNGRSFKSDTLLMRAIVDRLDEGAQAEMRVFSVLQRK